MEDNDLLAMILAAVLLLLTLAMTMFAALDCASSSQPAQSTTEPSPT